MHEPAIYEICVTGHRADKWSDQFGGIQITENLGASGQQEAILVGRFVDQGALMGVLHTLLYDLHLSLVSVRCVDSGG
jgi:hypothetical protein